MRKLAILGLAALFAACADTPTQPATGTDFGPLAFYSLTIAGNTQTHDFNELPDDCLPDVAIADPYDGLTFVTTPYLASCMSPNGTIAVTPANTAYSEPFELQFDLPNPATAVSIQSYDARYGDVAAPYPPVLNAYNAEGLVGTDTDLAPDETAGTWVTLGVTAPSGVTITRVGLLMPQGYHFLDDLVITYVPQDPEPELDPASKGECMNGGWETFGFRNQGQCVRFVQTGQDSR